MAQFAIDEILTTGIQISGFVFDVSNNIGTNGYVLTSTSSGVMWQQDSSNADLSALSGQIAATGTLLNNRINSLSGYVNGAFVSGSGVANYVARWSNTKELITGSIYDLGTGVGIGTTRPVSLLTVGAAGSTSAANGISFGGDVSANLFRDSNASIATDGGFYAAGRIRSADYIQFNSNLYSNAFTNPIDINVGNSAGNAWLSAIRFNQGGYVGIGTNQPSGKLHVVSSVAGETVFRADGTNGTLFSIVDDLSDSLMSVNNSAGLPVLEVFADDRVIAGQYGSGDFVLKNNKIGIGVLNPGEKLDVNGNIRIGLTTTNTIGTSNVFGLQTQAINIQPNSSTDTLYIRYLSAGNYQLQTATASANGGSLHLQPYGGNVGIGLINPEATSALHIKNLAASAKVTIESADASESLINFSAQNSEYSVGFVRTAGSVNSLRFCAADNLASNEVMRLQNSNVGIGTTNPNTRLHIFASGSSVNLLKGVTYNDGSASFNNASLEYYDISTSNVSTITKSNYNAYFNKRGSSLISGFTVGNYNAYTQIDSGYVGLIWDYSSRIEIRNQATANTLAHFVADAGYVTAQGGVLGQAVERIGLFIRSQNQSSQTLTNQYGIYVEDLGGSTNNYAFYSNVSAGSNKYNIYSLGSANNYLAGNVGIGTTNPSGKLSVDFAGTGAFSVCDSLSSNVRVTIGTVNNAGFTYGLIQTYQHNTNAIGVSPLNIQPFGGKVGIGVTNPDYQLTVIGQNQATANLTDAGNKGGSILVASSINATDQGGAVLFATKNDANLYTPQFAIKSLFQNGMGSGIADLAFSSRLAIGNSSLSEVLRIKNNGNVGIGTATVGNKLTVYTTTQYDGYYLRNANGVVGTILGTSATNDDGTIGLYSNVVLKTNITANGDSYFNGGNVGVGVTNPSNKIQVSGGGVSFTTSTGLAVPMIGLTAINVAYIGPYATSTDGNAPTLVVFNQGSSVQQTYFYSSGRIAMVLNKEGRLNIAGNAGNTPPALLNVGPTSSVDAVSGMSFGNDSSANLYRSAASTIKTDGSINVVGAATLGPTNINGGTLGASPVNIALTGFTYAVNNGNISQLTFVEKRFATGGDWTTATTRIQKRVDVTDQAYIEFNPSGSTYGMALGVAAGGSLEALRIISNGRIGIGTTNPSAKLSLNKGSKDQFLALDIANNDQKYALYVDQDNNGSNSFSVWDATNSHTAIRYLPSSAGYWQLYTNNIERVRIDNAGNVGVGTTNMVGKLDVYDNTDGPLLSFVRNASAGSSAYSAFVLRRDGNNNGIVLFTNSSARSTDGGAGNSTIRTDYGNLNFGAGGSQHILTTGGNVGINNTSPSSKLHVVETTPTGTRIQLGTNTENASMNAGLTNDLLILNAPYGTNSATVSNSGAKWGIKFIGTLEANQFNSTRKTSAIYAVSEDPTAGYNRGTSLAFYTNAWFDQEYTERMRIFQNGNIGIGTTQPSYKLQIVGSGTPASPTVLQVAGLNDAGGDAKLIIAQSPASSDLQLLVAGTDTRADGFTANDQYILAGQQLNLFNRGNGSTYNTQIMIGRDGGYGNISFSTAPQNQSAIIRMYIASGGNVGIGTITPSKLLHVHGDSGEILRLSMPSNYTAGAGPQISFWHRADEELASIRGVFNETSQGNRANLLFGTRTSDALGVETKMTILHNGNVGIGNTIPTGLLNVIRNSNTTQPIAFFKELFGTPPATNILLLERGNNLTAANQVSSNAGLRIRDHLVNYSLSVEDHNSNVNFAISGTRVMLGSRGTDSLLNIGGVSSTLPASGITFGQDPQVNLYRIAEDVLRTDANLNVLGYVSVGGYIYTSAYIQVAQGNIYPGGYTSDLNLNIGNTAGNNWETAIKIKPGSYVGIGTTQPTGKLHVVSTVAGETVLRADGTNGTLFSVTDDLSDSLMSVNNSAGLPVLEVFADDRVVAGQYGSGDFVIRNNKVGIGTTNPLNKLSVIGAASIGSTSYNIAAPSNGLLVEGNVGIGTTSVGHPLEVYGTSMDPSLTPSAASIFSVNSLGVELAVGRMVTSPFSIWLQGKHATVGGNLTYPIVLNPLGNNVGIGTTNPSQLLHISSTTTAKLKITADTDNVDENDLGGIEISQDGGITTSYFGHDNTNSLILGVNSTTTPNIYIGTRNDGTNFVTSADAKVTILNGGNVGIGTADPQYKLDVYSTNQDVARFYNNQTTFGLLLGSTSNTSFANLLWQTSGGNAQFFKNASSASWGGTNSMNLYTSNGGIAFHPAGTQNAVFFNTNGNVGINTTAPTNTLQVVGQIAIRGDESADNAKIHIQASDNSNRYTIETDLDGNTANDLLIFRSNTADNMLVLKGNGNIGINTTNPADKIHISGGGISFTSSTGLAIPMLGVTATNVAYVGPYTTTAEGVSPSLVLFNQGASVQQTWFYSSGRVAMVLNKEGRLHIGNTNNTPNCLLSVGPSSSTTAVSGMCFGNDAQANLYRSAEDTIKTDGNLVVAGTTSLNGHIYGQKTVALSTASWTTVLTVNMLSHNSCYVKIGAFGDWSNHSAIAFVSELFIQNGDNAYNTPGTIITAHDNTAGAAGDKVDIQIVDPAAAGTQNFLIQLKLISATSSTNSSLITYHVMGQQASVT